MNLKKPIALVKSIAASLSHLLNCFGQWWLREFLSLFPEQIAERLVGRRQRLLALSTNGDEVVLDLLGRDRHSIASERIKVSEYSMANVGRFLQSHGVDRGSVDIGIRLSADDIYCRKLLLPAEAAGSIENIAMQDLARRTPFRSIDVYHGYAVMTADGGDKLTVWQWITRRKVVEDTAPALRIDLNDVVFVDAVPDSERIGPSPFITLRSNTRPGNSWVQKSTLMLAYCAVVLGFVACGVKYWRQQVTMEYLDSRISVARVGAHQVRTAIDKYEQRQKVLERLRSQARAPGLIDVLEEASRVLPSHSWLTEFRLFEVPGTHERRVSMVGFSAAAPNLVSVINSSPLFSEAALTAPVAMDVIEGRERFALEAKIRMPESIRESAQ